MLLMDFPTPAATALPDFAPAAGVIPRLLKDGKREPLFDVRARTALMNGLAVPLIACIAELIAPPLSLVAASLSSE
jgi:hypothetical protein